MRRTTIGKKWGITAAATLVAFALTLLPAAVRALTPCPTPPADLCDPTKNSGYYNSGDCDTDGLTDQEECEGFLTAGQVSRPINGYVVARDGTTADKLNPSRPDLFLVVTDNNGYALKPGSLMYEATNGLPGNVLSVYSSRLGITTHRLDLAETAPGRLVASTARAAWIEENPSRAVGGTYLGETPQGTPAMAVKSTIYTQKIKDNVDKNCPPGKYCYVKGTSPLVDNANGTNNTPIVNYYILQVISHEMGHGSLLAPTNLRSYWHYSKSGTVMDPQVSFSQGVYTIPTVFDPVKDPPAVTLK